MTSLYKRQRTSNNRFGDVMVLGFLLVQCLDGVFTYLGVKTWGPAVEANPLVSSAIAAAGLGLGLVGAKLVASASASCSTSIASTSSSPCSPPSTSPPPFYRGRRSF